MFKEFIKNLIKYKEYILYSTKVELKTKLSTSYLGYLWWILDPLLFMLIYMLVVLVIFKRTQENFHVFVFLGLLPWKWMSGVIQYSSISIKGKIKVLEQVYAPKYIFPLTRVLVDSVEFLISILIVIVMLLIFKIKITPHIFEFFVVFVINLLVLYSLTLPIAHIGVFFADIRNILQFVLRLGFYMSPILYDLNSIPEKFRFIWWFNPATPFILSYRNIFLYGKSPLYVMMGIWLIIGVIFMWAGLLLMMRFDKNYTKVS